MVGDGEKRLRRDNLILILVIEMKIIGTIIVAIFVYLLWINAQKKREEERIRKEKEEEQKNDIRPILKAVGEFNQRLADFKNRGKYLSNFEIVNFKEQNSRTYNLVKNKSYKQLPNFKEEIDKLDSFLTLYEDLDRIFNERNESFVQGELKRTNELLSNVEGKSLDAQQRTAVIIDEDNQLVIAGAGSGKTTTIAGKVKYLTQKQNIDPQSILLISFTNNSAKEMQDRITRTMKIDVPVKTFHSLGLEIIAKVKNEKPSVFGDNKQMNRWKNESSILTDILKSFVDELKKDRDYFKNYVEFLLYHLRPFVSAFEFKSDGEHNNYLNEQKLEGLKMVETELKDETKVTYRERLKSQEEVRIANFLFINGIEYEYEQKYEHHTANMYFGQYKPDFYLPDYKIYVEHFGIDENGNVPDWFKARGGTTARQAYNEGIEWKRGIHKEKGTTLIETYSWQQGKNILLPVLEKQLKDHGVEFKPLSKEEIMKLLSENGKKEVDDFSQLILSFLNLFKSSGLNMSALKTLAKNKQDDRAVRFLDLFEPILNKYELYLHEKEMIDFSDMISQSTDFVQSGEYESTFDYIIIDEYQDVSKARFKLIKALLDQKPNTKLFCVGDDWQSIYRFAGSDIGLFTKFDQYYNSSSIDGYERATHRSFIENTYRFSNQLIEYSSKFIMKNKNQIEKKLKSHILSDEIPFTIFQYSDPLRQGKNINSTLRNVLLDIGGKSKNEEVSVLLLGRYVHELNNIESILSPNKNFDKDKNPYDYSFSECPNLKIRFLTAHKSKGLQDDYVVITNCSSGTYGFPSEISDDPLLSLLLSESDHFPNGEERRLFYVAMTRAKKHVYFLVNQEYPSKFIKEFGEIEQSVGLNCPQCDNGRLEERRNKETDMMFFGCNNYHYCKFTRNILPNDLKTLANAFYEKKDFVNAIEYYEKYLEKANGSFNDYYRLGLSYLNQNKCEKSLANLNKAVSIDNMNADVYFYRATAFCVLNRIDECIMDLHKSNEIKPKRFQVNKSLAAMYFKTTDYLKALEYIDLALSMKPRDQQTIDLKNKYFEYLKNDFISNEKVVESSDQKMIERYLQLAIDLNLKIKFNYYKSPDFDQRIRSLRTILPQGFLTLVKQESLYVFGYCYLRKEERTFNVDRISNLVINPNEIEFWIEER